MHRRVPKQLIPGRGFLIGLRNPHHLDPPPRWKNHAERNEEDPGKLSEQRAKIAFAFLGDHFTWGRIAQEEKWGVWEQQHILQAMGFYEGKTDGIRGPKTDKAILDFITWLNETECKGINPMLGFTEDPWAQHSTI